MIQTDFGAGKDVQDKKLVKKRQIRKFQSSWLSEPAFVGWLQRDVDDPKKPFCTSCHKSLLCNKSHITRHSQTKQHARNQLADKVPSVTKIPPVKKSKVHRNNVKAAEIRLSAFFAEHNIAIGTVKRLIRLLKKCFKDSEIVQDVSLCRTKCTKIITKCLGRRVSEKLEESLKIQKFSVLVDESTDITDTKSLCVLAQFVSPQNKEVVTELLELVELDATNCSAENVYAAFKTCLVSKGIPIANIVGMASDNASVMVGARNSFMSRLKTDVPKLVVFNCICHSSALIASKCCAILPGFCEQLIQKVSTYVSGSAKRSAMLREFQELLEINSKKILKLSGTRWLSMQKCVARILENWDPLKFYFALAVNEDKNDTPKTILALFNEPKVKAYLLFLKYSLSFFNTFNAKFQARKVLIHKLAEESRQLIAQFGGNFLRCEVLPALKAGSLNVADPDNQVELEKIILGPECEEFLTEIPPHDVQEIRQTCLRFYITAVTEMAHRLPIKDPVIEDLRFLAPQIALGSENRGNLRELNYIGERFGTINSSRLAFEWNVLPSFYQEKEKERLLTLEVDLFWKEVLQAKDESGEKMFPALENLVETVLSLPHSNAEAERIFSIVTDVKTKKRNKIGHECLNSICKVRSAFRNEKIDCNSFQVDSRHLELHCTRNLYR